MRVLAIVRVDTEAGSEALRNGILPKLLDHVMSQVQPEVVYFGPLDGMRTMFLVFDLEDPSRMPPLLEPLFSTLKAKIQLTPVMKLDELQAGHAALADLGASAPASKQ